MDKQKLYTFIFLLFFFSYAFSMGILITYMFYQPYHNNIEKFYAPRSDLQQTMFEFAESHNYSNSYNCINYTNELKAILDTKNYMSVPVVLYNKTSAHEVLCVLYEPQTSYPYMVSPDYTKYKLLL